MATHTWDLWIPDAASRGISFGRGVMSPATDVMVHSAPGSLRVEVRDQDGALVAFGDNLKRTADTPMTRLRIRHDRIEREDAWPLEEDRDRPVILPGGEVGILKHWWNAADHSEWRWLVEFYNHR